MVKILMDPVYTGRPSTCSTSFLAWEIIDRMVSAQDDVFFYLMVPERALADEDDIKFLSRHPDRVELIAYAANYQDRVSQLFQLPEGFRKVLSLGETPYWDWDGVITSRITQIPFMRNFSGRPMPTYPKGLSRFFIGLEEMPVFSFRDTVSWSQFMDLQTMSAYMNADRVVVSNTWTRKLLDGVARKYLSPSNVMSLLSNVEEAYPVKLGRLAIKKKAMTDTANVVFTGRMTGTRNFKGVAELFRKHFSFPIGKGGKKVRYIVSTNSLSSGSTNAGEIDFMEFQQNNREQFHKMLKKEAHVVVNLSTVEDFSLSTYEPLALGVPVVVPNKPWADFLGPEYPFRVAGEAEAYAMVKEFIINYDQMIDLFKAWEKVHWKVIVEDQAHNRCTPDVVCDEIVRYMAHVDQKISDSEMGQSYRDVVKAVTATDREQVDIMAFAAEHDLLQSLDKPGWPDIPIAKRPNLFVLKRLMNLGGWQDMLMPGMFRRS